MSTRQRSSTPATTRREFLTRSAALAGVAGLPAVAGFPVIVRSSALGADAAVAPSERVGLGVIGLGIQGNGNMKTFRWNKEVRVAAVCDVHQTQRDEAKQSVDEFYKNTDCAAYRDFREMIARKDIDAVQVTAPDHWHPLIVLEAVKHRKHIYCEKPIGWSIRAAQAVRKAVRDSGVVFQFGTQQRSGGNFRFACELVRNGRIGQLKTILVGVPGSWTCPKQPTEPVPKELDYEMWLGPAPMAPYCYQRCRPYVKGKGYSVWYSIMDYCLGMIANWGIHHLDIAQWGNGTDLSGPAEIQGTGTFPKDMLTNAATNWQVENRYANGVTLVHMDDGTSRKHPLQVAGFGHGVMFLGSEGWVHVDRQRLSAKRKELLKEKLGPNEIHLFKSDNHHYNFIDSIKGRTKPAAPIDTAVASDIVSSLQHIAARLNRPLKWDPKGETFINDDEANAMLDRPMRGPWKLA